MNRHQTDVLLVTVFLCCAWMIPVGWAHGYAPLGYVSIGLTLDASYAGIEPGTRAAAIWLVCGELVLLAALWIRRPLIRLLVVTLMSTAICALTMILYAKVWGNREQGGVFALVVAGPAIAASGAHLARLGLFSLRARSPGQ